MPSVLIACASSHGHTAKIAERVAQHVRSHGLLVAQADLLHDQPAESPGSFDGVILAASVHVGKHQPEAVKWATRWSETLAERPTAFLSVSLSAAEETDKSHLDTRRWQQEFAATTGWTPDRVVSIAGALEYREYGFATRLLMKLLMRRGGHPTDTSRDYDYTDWDAIDRFAADFCASLGPAVDRADS